MTPSNGDLADEVVGIVRDVLGDAVLGAYLHGSAVMGGLRPTSDVDVLIVLRRPMSSDERAATVEGLLQVSGRRARRGPARPVELTMVVQSDVRPWRYPPSVDFQYGEWLRDACEAGILPAPGPSPDLAPLITMTLAGDAPLFGPPPAELLDPVPMADFRQAILAGVPGLLADLETDTRNVLLTLARIWSTLATGEIRTKDAAADWALPRLPKAQRAALARARDMYLEGFEDDAVGWAGLAADIRAGAGAIVGEIAALPS
jgi:streptomycin 3"-adenylyltransferase